MIQVITVLRSWSGKAVKPDYVKPSTVNRITTSFEYMIKLDTEDYGTFLEVMTSFNGS